LIFVPSNLRCASSDSTDKRGRRAMTDVWRQKRAAPDLLTAPTTRPCLLSAVSAVGFVDGKTYLRFRPNCPKNVSPALRQSCDSRSWDGPWKINRHQNSSERVFPCLARTTQLHGQGQDNGHTLHTVSW